MNTILKKLLKKTLKKIKTETQYHIEELERRVQLSCGIPTFLFFK